MTHQHDVDEFLVIEDADDVLDMRIEIDRSIKQVRAIGQPSECRREHRMTGCLQQRHHAAPTPGAVPGAVNEHD